MKQNYPLFRLYLTMFLSMLLLSLTSFGQIFYVKPSGSDANGGASWANAFQSIQKALVVAPSGSKVLVAAGTYFPDEGFGASDNLRTSSFTLKNGVELYGGFEPEFGIDDLGDIRTKRSRLSGDLFGDDGPGGTNNSDNAFHVVNSVGVGPNTVLDRFNITAGNANGGSIFSSGGGMYNESASPTLTNCDFTSNASSGSGYGGGLYCVGSSSPILTNCLFLSNSAGFGGGMYVGNASSPTLINCSFSANTGHVAGGGINCAGSSMVMTSCVFSGNSTTNNGAGIYASSSFYTLTNCIFLGNTAGFSGAGIANSSSSSLLTNCLFKDNSAVSHGGGIYNVWSSPTLTNCIVWGNTASAGPEIDNFSSTPSISYSIVKGGYAGTGNLDLDPLFVDAANGNLHLQPCSPAIDAGSNAALPAGVLTDLDGNPRIVHTTVDMGVFETSGTLYTFYKDADGDGYGDASNKKETFCSTLPDGWVTNSGDCNDGDGSINPGADEACGGIDSNCDGVVVYPCTSCTQTLFRDFDGDGYGDPAGATEVGCFGQDGYVENALDCDDGNINVHPGATEICGNGIDDNCNGETDEDCGGSECDNGGPWYFDGDRDGYGSNILYDGPICDITGPEYVTNNLDCNDANASIHPGATEICGNGIDDNCDGQTDENCASCGFFTNPTTTNISSTSATFNWETTANPDQWQVQYKSTAPGSKWVDVSGVLPANRSVTVTSLKKGQNYMWHIRAKCGKIWTKYSNSIPFQTTSEALLATRNILAEAAMKNEISIGESALYPNPARNQVTIQMKLSAGERGTAVIQLLDMNGKGVMTQTAAVANGVFQKQVVLPSSLANGLYVVRITVNGKQYFKKLMINK